MTNTIGAKPEERELIEQRRIVANAKWLRGFAGGELVWCGKHAADEKQALRNIADALESLISDRAKLREALERAKEAIHRLEDGGPPTPPHDLALIDTAINTTKGQSK